MTFNAETTINHFPKDVLVAAYHRGDQSVLLIQDWKLYVASFKNGYCNNASGFEQDYERAWDFFDEIRADMKSEKK